MVERFNQTLQRMLAKFVNSKKTQWSSFLDTCVFAYNTSRHDSTRFTPFELMFGRCATLPVDLEVQPALPEEEVDNFCNMHELNLTHLREERAQRLEEAKANIVAAQVKQKAQYDRKHAKAELFQKGQLVLRKDCRWKKKKGGKLDARFLGPYVIQRELQRGTYELRTEDCKSTVRATGAHLKPYNKPATYSHQSEKSQTVSHPFFKTLNNQSLLLLFYSSICSPVTLSLPKKTPFLLFLHPLLPTRVKIYRL